MSSDNPDHDTTEDTRIAHIDQFLEKSGLKKDRAFLIVLAGSNVGEMYKLESSEMILGRSSSCTIRLTDDGISRNHAKLTMRDGKGTLEDLGSANGTIVNGDPIRHHELRDGDKIRLGTTTILKFTYSDNLDETFQKQMFDAALRDGLTGAYNKKYFADRLEAEFAYAKRHKTPLSVIMFDADHFKRVNDTYGHMTGDHVLQSIARGVMSTLRTEDIFARCGGEEFGIICRGVSLANAGILGERVRAIVEQTPMKHESTEFRITISVGVAAFPELATATPGALFAAADEALYEAKRTGRNRVLMKQGG